MHSYCGCIFFLLGLIVENRLPMFLIILRRIKNPRHFKQNTEGFLVINILPYLMFPALIKYSAI